MFISSYGDSELSFAVCSQGKIYSWGWQGSLNVSRRATQLSTMNEEMVPVCNLKWTTSGKGKLITLQTIDIITK